MLIVGVREDLQEKFIEKLTEAGIVARVWYECEGDEDVVVVPPEMVDEGVVLEVGEV